MKKTATVTFHAAHNYGSVLQAYALQNVVKSMGFQNDIINLRTERQKEVYAVFTNRKGVKYIAKNFSHLFYYKQLRTQHNKFENFINNRLNLSAAEFRNNAELHMAVMDYDCYIAGSDQIWNPVPADFDWAYYLDFVKDARKISYATSFGQLLTTKDKDTEKKISRYVNKFDFISVRERGSYEVVKRLTDTEAEIVPDPTLLLDLNEWDRLAKDGIKHKGDYLLFYTLFASREIMKVLRILSKRLSLPVVVTNFSNQYDVINGFDKVYSAGPCDFLSLVKNAKFVFVSSFHGTVFSILYKKPFFAFRGSEDARISNILNLFGLCDRSVDINDIEEKIDTAFEIDYSNYDYVLKGIKKRV